MRRWADDPSTKTPQGTTALLALGLFAVGFGADQLTKRWALNELVIGFIAVDWFAIFNFGDVLTVAEVALWAIIFALFVAPRPNASRAAEAGTTPTSA